MMTSTESKNNHTSNKNVLMCKQEFIPILTIINILFTKWDYNPLGLIRLYINFPVVMTGY